MPPLRPFRPALAALAAAGLLTGALSACGSSADNSTPTAATTASPTASATGPAVTAPGTALGLNQPATLDWTAKQGVTGLLQVTVTQLQRTSYTPTFAGWKIPTADKNRTPYFVRATVKNVGTTQLGGYNVPLYGLDSGNNLIEASSFGSDFAACHPNALPATFGPGSSAQVCLVTLATQGNQLLGASYRPDPTSDPITWKGTVEKYVPAKPQAHRPAKKSRATGTKAAKGTKHKKG